MSAMTNDAENRGGGAGTGGNSGTVRRRNSVAPNPWRRGRRRPSQQVHDGGLPDSVISSTGSKSRLLAGLFSDPSHAERAYQALFARGYCHDEVIVAMPETVWKSLFADPASAADDAAELAGRDAHAMVHAGTASTPVPVRIASRTCATRVMAAGRIAAKLAALSPKPDDAALSHALAACGIPERLTHDCAAGIEDGKILLGVLTHSIAETRTLSDEWESQRGEVCYCPMLETDSSVSEPAWEAGGSPPRGR
jgi:hypothetical protein